MSPRVVRPRSDEGPWLIAAVLGVAALGAGYVTGRRVFNPGIPRGLGEGEGSVEAAAPEGPEPAPGPAGASSNAANTAGAARADAGAPVVAAPTPPPPRPVPQGVPVRVVSARVQSCGDGDELTLNGADCANATGLEEALRHNLQRLGTCPSARGAAATPEATLYLGLRVDFARHRVTALLGRNSTVRDSLTYAACASSVLRDVDDVWRLHLAHVRYLYQFSVRFGPLGAGAAASQEAPSLTGSTPSALPSEAPAATGTPSSATPSASAHATPSEPTPVAAPAPAPTPAVVPTPAPAPAPVPSEAPAPVAASTPGAGTGTPAATPDGGAPFNPQPLRRPVPAVVTQSRALIREFPRTGTIIARLPQGTTIELIAHDGSWFQVRYGHGNTGWVYNGAIQRQE